MKPNGAVPLRLIPVTFQEARVYVGLNHRHNEPPIACRVSVGIQDDEGTLRGVGMLGVPKARMAADGRTAEVIRVATDGVPNGNSMLYGALVRAAEALGYDRVITYTLPDESGSSLKATGWTCLGEAGGGEWGSGESALRMKKALTSDRKPTLFWDEKQPRGPKLKWQRTVR